MAPFLFSFLIQACLKCFGVTDEKLQGVSLFVRLARPSQVSLGETLKGESAVMSLDEIGTPVRFDFKVSHHLLLCYCEIHSIAVFNQTGQRKLLCLVFLTDNKFGQTTEIFRQCITKHRLAKGERCGKMASVLDSDQQ